MLKDKRVWIGIVVTVLFLGYFLKGMSFFGIPGGQETEVLIALNESALEVIVNGRAVVSEKAAETDESTAADESDDGKSTKQKFDALADLPDTFRWVTGHPWQQTIKGLGGIVDYNAVEYGVTDRPPAEIEETLAQGTVTAEAQYGGSAGWKRLEWSPAAPAQPADGPLQIATTATETEPQARGAAIQRPDSKTVYLKTTLIFHDVPENSQGTGFYFGSDDGNGLMVLFSDEWSSAWVERLDNGQQKEIGRIAGIWPALKKADYIWLIPASFFLAVSLYFRAFRWRIFFGDLNQTSIPRLFGVISIGFLGNAVLPLRAGELIRAWLGGKENNCPFSASLGTLVVERLFDAVAMVALLVFVLVVAKFPEVNEEWLSILKGAGYFFGFALTGIVVFLFGLTFQRDLALRILHRCTGFLPHKIREKIWHMADAFADGLSSLRSPSKLLWSTIHTILVWGAIVISEYFVLAAFGLEHQVGIIGAAFVMVVICFMIAAPSSPGYVGIFHTAIKVSLIEFYGISASTAMGCAIILHASQMAFIILLGTVSMLLMGVSLRDMKKHTQDDESEGSTGS